MAGVLRKAGSTWKGVLRSFELGSVLSEPTMLASTVVSRPFATPATPATARRTRTKAKVSAAGGTPKSAEEKKPPTAYALYMKEVFPSTKAANPSADFANISKAVSGQWKSLSEPEKAKYLTASAAAKAAWEAKQPPKPPKPAPVPKQKKAKSPDAPKKPPTPYAAYVKHNFSRLSKPGASAPDTMKLLGAEWRGLSDSEKAKYKSP